MQRDRRRKREFSLAKENKNVVQRESYVGGRVLQLCAAQKCCREQLQAVKIFQWECHSRRRIKRDNVLSVLYMKVYLGVHGVWA